MKIPRPKLFFLIYIAFVAVLSLVWFANRYMNEGAGAAVDNINITFSPTTGTFNAGEQKDLDILLQSPDSSKKISGVNLAFITEGSAKITSVTTPVPFPGTDTTVFTQITNVVGSQSAQVSYVSFKSDAELPSVVKIKVSFMGTGAGTGAIKLDTAKSQIVGNIASIAYGFGTVDQGQYTFNDQSGSVGLRVEPASVFLAPGEETTMSLAITDTPAGKGISGFDVKLNYDPQIIEVVSLGDPIDGTTGGDANKFTMIKKEIDSAGGVITVTYISSLPQSQLPVKPKMNIQVKGKQPGSGVFTISYYEITGNIPQVVYTVNKYESAYEVSNSPSVSPTPTPNLTLSPMPSGYCADNNQCTNSQACVANSCLEVACSSIDPACSQPVIANHTCTFTYSADGTTCPTGVCQSGVCVSPLTPTTGISPTPVISPTQGVTPTVIPTGTGAVKINLKARFQGIVRKPQGAKLMTASVMISGPALGGQTVTKPIQLTVDDAGVWLGTLNVDVPAGDGYKIYLKGSNHLQKKICESSPTETVPGTYRCGDVGKITLQNGDNTVDLSSIVFLTGDLPDQNGIVDSYDISYIRLNLGSMDPKVVSIGDINRDGIVDTQDYSLIIASLSVKYDEL